MTEQELAELDLAVARAENDICTNPKCSGSPPHRENGSLPRYTRDGAEAMRLLEKHSLNLALVSNVGGFRAWEATGHTLLGTTTEVGPTPAIAICRAVVALQSVSPECPTKVGKS